MIQANSQTAANQPAGQSPAATPADRLVRLPETLRTVGLGRTAWLDRVRAGEAPQPVRTGRATAWLESELQAFIAERVRASRKGR